MSDLTKEKTPVSNLDIGMFVTALDRPWLDTPFLLEGLLIEDRAQIAMLQSLCKFVYVDRTMSVGKYFVASLKTNTVLKLEDTNPSSSNHLKEKISQLLDWLNHVTKNNDDTQGKLSQIKTLGGNDLVENEIAQIYSTYQQSEIATRKIFEALANNQKIDITQIDEILDTMVDSIERNPDALIWLTKLKQTDTHAYNHALNVSITLMAFASFIALPKVEIKNLGMAGLLQDVGKSRISNDLLRRTDKLTDAEFSILKKHVDYSVNILKHTANIPDSVLTTVAEHHERYNGKGYPNQLSGNKISLGGQLAGIIDTYCAITTNRSYAQGVYNHEALEQIQKIRGSCFSRSIVDQLVQFLGLYPVTSLVLLNSGEVGVVIQQNSVRRLQPRVMILLNSDKTKNTFPSIINLINLPLNPAGEPYSIVCGLPTGSYGLNADNFYG